MHLVCSLRSLLHLHPARAILSRHTVANFNTHAFQRHEPRQIENSLGEIENLSGDAITLCKQGRLTEALSIFCFTDCPDSYTYSSLLQTCVNRKALAEGKLIHAHIIQTEFRPDTYLETKLVILYCTCGNLVDGRRVLDRLSERNVVSWTAMIAAYARYGFVEEALALFHQMQQTGIQPDHFAFASVLPACANLAALEYGKELHDDIVRNGFQSDMFVGNALVDMYGKCGRVLDARKVFNKMPERDVVSWTAVICGYAQNGGSDESLKLFRQMQCTNLRPNAVTVAGILSACSNLAALKQGKEIHKYIIRSWFQSDAFVGGALVDMYAKCGSIEYACKVFDKISEHDVVSWTAMIV